MDAQTLRVAVLAHVARLHKHWSDGLQVLNGIRRAANRAQLSEADVAEALTTYFEFGKLKPSNDGGGGGEDVVLGSSSSSGKRTDSNCAAEAVADSAVALATIDE